MKKKNPETKTLSLFYALLVGILFISTTPACTRPSAEKKLLNSLENCLQSVNKRNLSDLKELIAADYLDFMNNDRQKILDLLSTYFQTYQQFRAKILGRRVNLNLPNNSATIHCDVSLLSSAKGLSISFFNSTQSLLRIELSYKRNGNKWLINSASWREISLEEILPETIPLLPKTIFSDKGNH